MLSWRWVELMTPMRHRVLKAEGAAKGESKLADMHLVGVGQVERRQAGGFDLEQGKIGECVAPQNLGGKALGIFNAAGLRVAMAEYQNIDGGCVLDDMGVGQDVARGIDDDAGAESLLLGDIRLPRVGVLHRGQTGDFDGHHRRPDALGQRLQILIEREQAVADGAGGGLAAGAGSCAKASAPKTTTQEQWKAGIRKPAERRTGTSFSNPR